MLNKNTLPGKLDYQKIGRDKNFPKQKFLEDTIITRVAL